MIEPLKRQGRLLRAAPLIVLGLSLWEQPQALAAKPQASSSSVAVPSLEETEEFIAEKVNAQGSVFGTSGKRAQPGKVYATFIETTKIDIKSCVIQLNNENSISTIDHKIPMTGRFKVEFNMKNSETIKVDSGVWNEPPNYPISEYFQVEIFGRGINYKFDNGDVNPSESISFVFREKDMAMRVAKAFAHEIILCGGGQKEPF